MKIEKLHSAGELVDRVVGYVAFVEQHRSNLKDVGGNSKAELAQLEQHAREIKLLSEKVDKAGHEFQALRADLKARIAELEVAFDDQLTYAREFAKHHRLTVIREGLKNYGRQRKQRRESAGASANGEAEKPAA